jgi:putative transposase
VKYVPHWPSKGFGCLEACRAWVTTFVAWYNTEHKHSSLHFVTPSERHSGKDTEILRHRAKVVMEYRQKRPECWSGKIRTCEPIGEVHLNPEKEAA